MSQKQFDDYRMTYASFIYKDYHARVEGGELKVFYEFEIPGLRSFTSKWVFPLKITGPEGETVDCSGAAPAEGPAAENASRIAGLEDPLQDPILKEMLFSLGMAETISYFKTVCPKRVEIPCGNLSPWQQAWWKKLYFHGLGEFLYLNDITVDLEDLVHFAPASEEEEAPRHDETSYEGYLVPVGGGKDSVVSLELLREERIVTYVINGNETTKNVCRICDHRQGDYVARRILDKGILELNEQGYLNGHIPFSAVVAFSSVVAAYLLGLKDITLSNETSANESTVKGSTVNHQYSKSYEFESDFTAYFSRLTDSDIHYYSLLRPLTELQIASLFARRTAYHKAFRSCNRGSKQGIWCCNCPKCLFVYIILLPFLSISELHEIFGEDLLEKESLDGDFRALTGIADNKPFECVGTRREVHASLSDFVRRGGHSLLTDRYGKELSQIPELSAQEGFSTDIDEMLKEWVSENHVPEALCERIREALRQGRRTEG